MAFAEEVSRGLAQLNSCISATTRPTVPNLGIDFSMPAAQQRRSHKHKQIFQRMKAPTRPYAKIHKWYKRVASNESSSTRAGTDHPHCEAVLSTAWMSESLGILGLHFSKPQSLEIAWYTSTLALKGDPAWQEDLGQALLAGASLASFAA